MTLLVIPDHTFALGPSWLMELSDNMPGWDIAYHSAVSLTEEHIRQAEIIFGCPPIPLLAQAKNLTWLHLPNAGVGEYANLHLYPNHKITLTKSSGVYGIPAAEQLLAFFLSFSRGLPRYDGQKRARIWKRHNETVELQGATVAVFGLGDIGLSVSERLRALGCRVLGVRRDALNKPGCVDEITSLYNAESFLNRADFVANCLPLTQDTQGYFDRTAFAAMKRGAIFANVGRGGTVVTEALVEALQNGSLRGAGLDVTDPEPLPEDHPLWDEENVVLTAHSACFSPQTDARRFNLFLELVRKYLRGERLHNTVDFFWGY